MKNTKIMYKCVYFVMALIYLPGLLFFPFFEDAYKFYFNYTTQPLFPLIIVGSIFLIFYRLFTYVSLQIPSRNIYVLGGVGTSLILLFLSSIYLFSAIDFFLNYESSFRHKSRLSDAGPFVAILFALKPIVDFLILLMLIYKVNGTKFGVITRISLLFITIASLISINSSLQIVLIPIILILWFKPDMFLQRSKISFTKMLLVLFLAPIMLTGVLFVGIGNKIGYEILLSDRVFGYIYSILGELTTRVSTSLITLTMLWDYAEGDFLKYIELSYGAGESLFSTFQNRFSLLIGSEFDSSLIATVDRTNFLLLFREYHPRAGASPGILGSMYYFPLFPMGFVFIPLFYVYLFRRISSHMKSSTEVNVFFLFSISYLSLGLFESPLNFLMIVDPIFFLMIFVIFTTKIVNLEKTFVR